MAIPMSNLLVNIDVENLEQATQFQCRALGLRIGRPFEGWVELLVMSAPIYLVPKAAGTSVSPKSDEKRDYRRHWTAVHLDFVVDDLESAVARAKAAGASVESEI